MKMFEADFDWEEDLIAIERLLWERLPDVDEMPENRKVNLGIFSPEGLEGFFAALHTMPEMVKPSQWLDALWGAFPPVLEDTEAVEREYGRLMLFYNAVGRALREDRFVPMWLAEDDEEYGQMVEAWKSGGSPMPMVLMGTALWFEGYMRALSLFSEQTMMVLTRLDEMLDAEADVERLDEADQVLLEMIAYPMVFVKLLIEQVALDEPPPFRPIGDELLARKVLQMLEMLPVYLYETLEPARAQAVESRTFTRPRPKVGRNDPCPCGSGKKFKKCCLH